MYVFALITKSLIGCHRHPHIASLICEILLAPRFFRVKLADTPTSQR